MYDIMWLKPVYSDYKLKLNCIELVSHLQSLIQRTVPWENVETCQHSYEVAAGQ